MKLNKTIIQQDLLSWYDTNARVLPWRNNPSPYRVWISEIMLQQTRVEAVRDYFNRFMLVAPNIYALSLLSQDQLNKLWEGLGYYSRIRNIKKTAEIVISEYNGLLPSTITELNALPGIGPYTSGAIASIAFDQKFSAVDGNVLRVFARLTGNKNNIKDKETKQAIKSIVDTILPNVRNGDFNQALMELGATICLPNGMPKCESCPIKNQCVAYKENLQTVIPLKQIKKQRRIQEKTVLLIQFGDTFAIQKRPPIGLLSGLYEFINYDGFIEIEEIQKLYPEANITPIEFTKHIFTHIEWHMIGYHIIMDKTIPEFQFATKPQIEHIYTVPTAFKKYKDIIKKT